MKISQKIIASILAISLMLPTMVYAKPTESYNTPNTTSEDTDKTSSCEVTADIHYAYYIALPASLTLEPADWVKDAKKNTEMFNTTESDVLTWVGEENFYECWYQVKAKTKDGGLGGKYIKVAPRANKEAYTAYWLQEGESQGFIDFFIENGELDCAYDDTNYDEDSGDYYGDYYYVEAYMQNEDTGEWSNSTDIEQKRIYFGDTASEKVVKVDSNKWSSIDGKAQAFIENQGRYKGSFEFVYGLVDDIE